MAGRNKIATLIGLATLAGCQSVATGGEVPARITDATPQSRAALRDALNEALGREVLIADDALTSTNLLIIEQRPPANSQGRLASGRNMETPIQFRLVIDAGSCVLVDTRDDSRHVLPNTTCSAL